MMSEGFIIIILARKTSTAGAEHSIPLLSVLTSTSPVRLGSSGLPRPSPGYGSNNYVRHRWHVNTAMAEINQKEGCLRAVGNHQLLFEDCSTKMSKKLRNSFVHLLAFRNPVSFELIKADVSEQNEKSSRFK